MKPCEFEVEVLKACAGLDSKITSWGAAVGVSLEFLQARGFVTRSLKPVPTEKGWEYLEELGDES